MEFFTLDQLTIEGVRIGPMAELEVHNRPGGHGWLKVRAQVGEEDEEMILYGLPAGSRENCMGADAFCSRGF